MSLRVVLSVLILPTLSVIAAPEDRATKVRNDKEQYGNDDRWVYNDLAKGIDEAKKTNKPMLVIFRCIPCEACSQFDKQLMEKQNEVQDLLGKFVCVRIVQANSMDLTLFEFDFDQSFHAVLMNADKTIYGRFGTRSRREEQEDMTMSGLREAMLAALDLHERHPADKTVLAAKRGEPPRYNVPELYPLLAGKYKPTLDYTGKVVQSCLHCHQVRDAERAVWRSQGKLMPQKVLFPFPLPDTIGLRMDPAKKGTIAKVAEGSATATAGLMAGDEIRTIAGQPILSTADIQWVLHNTVGAAKLPVVVNRGGEEKQLTVELADDWRRHSDISWRVSTWELRRMATGGILFEDLSAEERGARGLGNDVLALRAKHVGEYGEHAAAKNAGFRKDDIVIAFDGDTTRLTDSQFIAKALERKKGLKLPLTLLRGTKRMEMAIPMQ
jgi:thioredoxin-related protein